MAEKDEIVSIDRLVCRDLEILKCQTSSDRPPIPPSLIIYANRVDSKYTQYGLGPMTMVHQGCGDLSRVQNFQLCRRVGSEPLQLSMEGRDLNGNRAPLAYVLEITVAPSSYEERQE